MVEENTKYYNGASVSISPDLTPLIELLVEFEKEGNINIEPIVYFDEEFMRKMYEKLSK